jgi:hypothetical protein
MKEQFQLFMVSDTLGFLLLMVFSKSITFCYLGRQSVLNGFFGFHGGLGTFGQVGSLVDPESIGGLFRAGFHIP